MALWHKCQSNIVFMYLLYLTSNISATINVSLINVSSYLKTAIL
jgi:hypothetical protein